MTRALCLIFCGLSVMAGCDQPPAQPTQTASSRSAPPPPPPPPTSQSEQVQPTAQPGQPAGLAGQSVPGNVAQPASGTEQVKAQAGVAKAGRSLDDPNLNRMIVTPARAYFRARERIVFEVQVPHALQLYKALNGAAPKTQEEFMNQVVKANNIALPELPPGSRYVYAPEKEELLVERPAPVGR